MNEYVNKWAVERRMIVRPALFALILLIGACKEDFPPYREPENVLAGELTQTSPDTINVTYDPVLDMYFLESPMIFNVEVTNTLEDLLQGAAQVQGTITVQSFSQIPRVVLVTLTTGNLLQPPVFQGNIAVPPGGSAQFSTLWLPMATDGEIVFEGLPFTVGGGARIYGPITFHASAEVQIFERVQPIRFGALEFARVFSVR